MWLGHVVPGSFRRQPSTAARGPQPRLGLRPAVPYSVAPSSSSPTPPRGPQSPIGACAAGDAEQSVRSETDHAQSPMA